MARRIFSPRYLVKCAALIRVLRDFIHAEVIRIFLSDQPERLSACNARPCTTASRSWVRGAALGLVVMLSFSIASACPFCLIPPQTWAEMIDDADLMVVGELLSSRVDEVDGRATSRFLVRSIRVHGTSKNQLCLIEAGQILTVDYQAELSRGQLFVLLGQLPLPDSDASSGVTFAIDDSDGQRQQTDDGQRDGVVQAVFAPSLLASADRINWTSITPITSAALDYIQHAPPNPVSSQQRLPYYISFLQHPDELIASDAWAEFARADYQAIVANRALFPRQQLRSWIADPEMLPERLGTFGMLLGLCGDAADAEFLRQQAGGDLSEPDRFGTEGVWGGYLLITGQDGLNWLDEHLLQSVELTDGRALAILSAMEFMRRWEADAISTPRLCRSLRLLLNRPALRSTVITTLARWKDWELLPQLEQSFDDLVVQDKATCRVIVEFARTLQKSPGSSETPAAVSPSDLRLAELQKQAAAFIARVERDHPEIIQVRTIQF
ncbi:MAG: hypothetical protein KDA85_13615 [Planctomycetaceae bacterium]|nr:hypothetical protein [Planctomycetaceae bacterium]